MTRLCDALEIPTGVTAVVGGGGKTSLIGRLAGELSAKGRVLCLTTTHIFPPNQTVLHSPSAEALEAAFSQSALVTVGEPLPDGRLGPPRGALDALIPLADYVLIEADGSRGLPVKAPADHEPALTGKEQLVIAVAGISAIGEPIANVAHRPQRYAALLGKDVSSPVTPQDVACVLMSENGQRKAVKSRFAVALNQCDTPERLSLARLCAARMNAPCALLALKARPELCEGWRMGKCLYW